MNKEISLVKVQIEESQIIYMDQITMKREMILEEINQEITIINSEEII